MAYQIMSSQILDTCAAIHTKLEIKPTKSEFILNFTDLYSWMESKKEILAKHIRRELEYRSPMIYSLTIQAIVKSPQMKSRDYYYSNDMMIYAANDEEEIDSFLSAMFKYLYHQGKIHLQEKHGQIHKIMHLIMESRSRDDME